MYNDFTIFDVMSLVGFSTNKLRASGGYYDCPVCGRKRTFNINPTKGYGGSGVIRCAACNVGGDKIDLYILASGSNYSLTWATASSGNLYERPSSNDRSWALRELADRLHLARKTDGFVSKNALAQKKIEEFAQKSLDSSRSPKERNEVYMAFLDMLSLSKNHRENLLKRGLTDDAIDRIGFRSLPSYNRTSYAKKLIAKGFDLEGIPGFFKLSDTDEWSIYSPDPGFLVPYRNEEGYITFMEIRLNNAITDSKGKERRYCRFSSNRDSLESGSRADGSLHVEMCSELPKYIYIVEGALKVIVARALYNELYQQDDIIFIAVPGISSIGGISAALDYFLPKYDIQRIVEWYDHDKYFKPNVMKARDNLERVVRETMARWRKNMSDKYAVGDVRPPVFTSVEEKTYRGKGLDDHLLAIKNERNAPKTNIL